MARDEQAMSAARLAEIRARAAAATPGPWDIPDGDLNGRILGIGPISGYGYDALELNADDPDAIFVSHARQDIDALLAEVQRLRAREAALVALLGPVDLLLALVRDEERGEETTADFWEAGYNELKQARALLASADGQGEA